MDLMVLIKHYMLYFKILSIFINKFISKKNIDYYIEQKSDLLFA